MTMEYYKASRVQFGWCKNGYNPNLITLTDPNTYTSNKPTPFGVQSLFLGASRKFACAQCKLRYGSGARSCPGHEGQIKLNTTVFAPGCIKHIIDICIWCCLWHIIDKTLHNALLFKVLKNPFL